MTSIIEIQKKAFLRLGEILFANHKRKYEILTIIHDADYFDEEEYVNAVQYFADYFDNLKIEFIHSLDWKTSITDLYISVWTTIRNNFSKEIILPRIQDLGGNIGISADGVFDKLNQHLAEQGFMLSLINDDTDNYVFVLHQIEDEYKVKSVIYLIENDGENVLSDKKPFDHLVIQGMVFKVLTQLEAFEQILHVKDVFGKNLYSLDALRVENYYDNPELDSQFFLLCETAAEFENLILAPFIEGIFISGYIFKEELTIAKKLSFYDDEDLDTQILLICLQNVNVKYLHFPPVHYDRSTCFHKDIFAEILYLEGGTVYINGTISAKAIIAEAGSVHLGPNWGIVAILCNPNTEVRYKAVLEAGEFNEWLRLYSTFGIEDVLDKTYFKLKNTKNGIDFRIESRKLENDFLLGNEIINTNHLIKLNDSFGDSIKPVLNKIFAYQTLNELPLKENKKMYSFKHDREEYYYFYKDETCYHLGKWSLRNHYVMQIHYNFSDKSQNQQVISYYTNNNETSTVVYKIPFHESPTMIQAVRQMFREAVFCFNSEIKEIHEARQLNYFDNNRTITDDKSLQKQKNNFHKLLELLLENEIEFYDPLNRTKIIIQRKGNQLQNNSIIFTIDNSIEISISEVENSKIYRLFNKTTLCASYKENENPSKLTLDLYNKLTSLWQSLLERAEKGLLYRRKFEQRITVQDILQVASLPLFVEKYNDYNHPDKAYFWKKDYAISFAKNGANNDPAKLRFGIGNQEEEFDARFFYLVCNSIDNPTTINLFYMSSQINKGDEVYRRFSYGSHYVSVFDWELYDEALEHYDAVIKCIEEENLEYLNTLSNSNSNLLVNDNLEVYNKSILLKNYDQYRVQDTIDRYLELLKNNFPNAYKNINMPASDEDIHSLEKLIGKDLPDDVKKIYKTCNGQNAIINDHHIDLLPEGEWLSIERLKKEWEFWYGLIDNWEEEDGTLIHTSESDHESVIKRNWWNRYWIPFTSDGGGNNLCIDLDPAEEGTYGQIISVLHDEVTRKVVALSLKDYFANLTENIIAKNIVLDETTFFAFVEKQYIENKPVLINMLVREGKIRFPNSFYNNLSHSNDIDKLRKIYKFSDEYAVFLTLQNGFNGYKFIHASDEERTSFLTIDDSFFTIKDNLKLTLEILYATHFEFRDYKENLYEINSENDLKSYFFIIGNDKGGSKYVEVLQGKYKGYVGYIHFKNSLDNKSFKEFVQQVGFESFLEFNLNYQTDMLCEEKNLIILVAKSFKEFVEECFYYVDGEVMVRTTVN